MASVITCLQLGIFAWISLDLADGLRVQNITLENNKCASKTVEFADEFSIEFNLTLDSYTSPSEYIHIWEINPGLIFRYDHYGTKYVN